MNEVRHIEKLDVAINTLDRLAGNFLIADTDRQKFMDDYSAMSFIHEWFEDRGDTRYLKSYYRRLTRDSDSVQV